MNIRNVMRRSAHLYPDAVAVVLNGEETTFSEAWTRGVRLANGLRELGLGADDPVGTLEENTLGTVDSLLACSAGGFPRVPLYNRNGRDSHVKMLRNAGAKALIVESIAVDQVEDVIADVPTLEHVIVRDEGYEDWLAAQSDIDPDAPVTPESTYLIRHTGGTTGEPKCLVLSNRQWMSVGRDYFYHFPPIAFGEATMHIGPLSHASGAMVIPGWAIGARQVLLDSFDPEACLDIMEQQGVSHAFVPPTAMAMLVRVPGAADRDWSKIKALMVGAAPINRDTILAARDVFGEDVLYQLYGQSEGSPMIGMGPKEWFARPEGSEPLTAVGKPLPWAEVELWNDDNEPVPIGEPGEIAFKCDAQIDGFLNMPEENAARFIDGWVKSGDVARMDENGYIYLLDRKNDMIISGGFNIYPRDLENVISAHEGVIEVAVFGVPHEKWGETPYAVCYVEESASVSEADIIAIVIEELGSYQKPAAVEFKNEPLPKTPVGKLARRVLREPHWAGRDSSVGGA